MTTTASRIVACLEAADYPAIADLYAPDVVLDMNLPTWRFQYEGADTVRDYFKQQTGSLPNLHCTGIRHVASDDRVVVESECRFEGEDGEYLWRAVDMFVLAGGQITEHAQYCTGCWTPADIARQAAEAPMVRW